MPRNSRIVLPTHPHHVVQHGHSGQNVFHGPADYERYLASLRELKREFRLQVAGYCLMADHVHLILIPDDVSGMSQLMKALAAQSTRHWNRSRGGRGTLWDGRYRSSVIEAERYLWACLRFIELNPVRRGQVTKAEDYPWSSARTHLGLSSDEVFDTVADGVPGSHPAQSEQGYRSYLEATIPQNEWSMIRSAVLRGQLTGSTAFVDLVEQQTGRRIEARGRGRPRSRTAKPDFGVCHEFAVHRNASTRE